MRFQQKAREVRERHRIEAAKAKQRQQVTQAKPGERIGSGNLPPPIERAKTRDKVGAVVGMSGRTYEKAEQVVKAAEEDPEAFGDLPEQMDKTGKVDKAYGELRKRKKRAELKDAAKAVTKAAMFECRIGDFRTALADILDASVPLIFASLRRLEGRTTDNCGKSFRSFNAASDACRGARRHRARTDTSSKDLTRLQALAEEHGVTRQTLHNDTRFSEAVDALAGWFGDAMYHALLDRVGLTIAGRVVQ